MKLMLFFKASPLRSRMPTVPGNKDKFSSTPRMAFKNFCYRQKAAVLDLFRSLTKLLTILDRCQNFLSKQIVTSVGLTALYTILLLAIYLPLLMAAPLFVGIGQ